MTKEQLEYIATGVVQALSQEDKKRFLDESLEADICRLIQGELPDWATGLCLSTGKMVFISNDFEEAKALFVNIKALLEKESV